MNLVVARSPEPTAETSLPSELLSSLQAETSQQQDMVVGGRVALMGAVLRLGRRVPRQACQSETVV